jgi:hypothetical protein
MSDSSVPDNEHDVVTAARAGYACGRLLAILAAIDSTLAGGTEPSPLIDSFAAAAAYPAQAFGPMLVRSLPSLAMVAGNSQETEMRRSLADRLTEIMATLGAEFPRSLTAEGQAAFALGFLQERMALRQLDPRAEPERQDLLVEEECIDPDDIFPDDL